MKPLTHFLCGALCLIFLLISRSYADAGVETDAASFSTRTDAAGISQMVLIMDDIGYNLPLGMRAAELPGSITYGVIPHTPVGQKIANYAMSRNEEKEILVHMPMQALNNNKLGTGGLTREQSQLEFIAALRAGLKNVPFAVGLSNHMGSELMQHDQPMNWLMSELQLQGYFFLDSRTSVSNVSAKAADALKVPYLKRDIFLDHDPDSRSMASAFERAKQLAKSRGMVVVIAHPYANTLTYLEQELPRLESENIQLITASQALIRVENQQLNNSIRVAAAHPKE